MRLKTLLRCVVLSAGLWLATGHAQTGEIVASAASPGLHALPEELKAFWALTDGRRVRARELAQAVIDETPNSYVAHAVLGEVEHIAEGNFPRAVYLLQRALTLFEIAHGEQTDTRNTWRWHSRILQKLAFAQGDLENHQAKLELLDRYNQLYDPDLLAQRVWPLMKLGRYEEARLAAKQGIDSGDARQQQIALNALCAIAAEIGEHTEHYAACSRTVEHAISLSAPLDTVDLINFAQASRALFRLDETERINLQAAEHGVAWYRNPWSELAELYIRQARLGEALNALKQVPVYRSQRPVQVLESDRNENRRALASFFLVMGRSDDALEITQKALVTPDRRSHTSRDPLQDESVITLLDRKAHRLAAERILEQSVTLPFWKRLYARMKAGTHIVRAWKSGKQAVRSVSRQDRLTGSFRIGTSDASIMPPWLVAELVSLVGAGAASNAIKTARETDTRPGASAYYNAFETEVAVLRGDITQSRQLITAALKELGPSERLLRARLLAQLVRLSLQDGDVKTASNDIQRALAIDPGIFRRMGMALPVQLIGDGNALSDAIRKGLERSPRISVENSPLSIHIQTNEIQARACLLTTTGSVLGCGQAEETGTSSVDELANAVLRSFHQEVFSPRVDLSETDAKSLDIFTTGTRNNILEDLL
ncbi:MAG: hypothetical protein KTR18_10465 [Acidiferrobacterales bacterium]|nr:hypothetical protein [Acidiferrobacterales bacterium]